MTQSSGGDLPLRRPSEAARSGEVVLSRRIEGTNEDRSRTDDVTDGEDSRGAESSADEESRFEEGVFPPARPAGVNARSGAIYWFVAATICGALGSLWFAIVSLSPTFAERLELGFADPLTQSVAVLIVSGTGFVAVFAAGYSVRGPSKRKASSGG